MRFIKKRSIVLVAAMALGLSVFAIGNAFAQTGSVMLYGSAGYHNVKEEFRKVHLNPLGNGWAFKSTFGLASFGHTTDKDSGHVSQDLNLGLNGSTAGVGVSKNIVFKKKNS